MVLVHAIGIAAALVIVAIGLLASGKPYLAWVLPGAAALWMWGYHSGFNQPALWVVGGAFVAAALLFGLRPLRMAILSKPLLGVMSKILPKMSDTERAALEAGTVWWDADLFTGSPNWRKLLDFRAKQLTDDERAFLEGPTEELCAMLNEWETDKNKDLPPHVWDFIRKKGFFGMIIPKEYGGLGFSSLANSSVVLKVSSRHSSAAVTVMVPNSLGPAELILHYGTDEQKKYYLPRLASGEDIPCFALTSPEAGSDAANTKSIGIVCKGMWEGQEVLGMRLTFDKRYITLSPVATILGLAFRLKDPDHLLGEKEDLGITCALVPPNLPGIDIGKRHDPLFNTFLNGPIWGKDVFVPLDYIIGGPKMAGQGWRMLMDCLAAGRGISLPATACAAGQSAVRGVGAYATIREQFDMPIGKFEGIEEQLARIAGFTYFMDGARKLTLGALDAGEKPAVLSAIVKRYLSEAQRQLTNDAMDVMGGAGISRGPRNVLARGYISAPISITVEGANILTRCLIIYGQGAIRCHPWVQAEMQSVAARDVKAFDRAFWGHTGFIFVNLARAFVRGLVDGATARPGVANYRLDQQLGRFSRMSAAFVMMSDLAMASLGANLKRAEKISGRFADALAWLYIGSATCKRFYDEGCREQDLPFMLWGTQYALYEVQDALSGIIDNMPNRGVAALMRLCAFPLGRKYRRPSDALGAKVARAILEDRDERLELSRDIYSPPMGEPGFGLLESALDKVMQGAGVARKIKDAVRAGKLAKQPAATLAARAVEAGVVTPDEVTKLKEAEEARWDAIQVDSFTDAELGINIHPEAGEILEPRAKAGAAG
ncbi:MAG: acyl-CoA dehydrogenase [Candidatus Sericytochromatia bacterium]|nr:acyl-CoA dehydrogenase [Candidatus Tanganyikabacteria bacterium]